MTVTYGADRLDLFLEVADELEDRFRGVVVLGVEAEGRADAFDVAGPAGGVLFSASALGRAPSAGEVAALLDGAGLGAVPVPAGVGCT